MPHGYDFYVSYSSDTPEWEPVGHLAARALTRTRGDNSFCIGTMLGVYAFGVDNRACLNDAYFGTISWNGVRDGGA